MLLNATDIVSAERLGILTAVFEATSIATLHSFRLIGLVVLLAGVVGPHFPAGLAAVGAYWDLATAGSVRAAADDHARCRILLLVRSSGRLTAQWDGRGGQPGTN